MDTITNKERDILKKFLSTKDYQIVADKSNFSLSTVCNILNQRTSINHKNEVVMKEFKKLLRVKVAQTVKLVESFYEADIKEI